MILVVEDDRDIQENLRDILELDGYRVDAVETVADALSHASARPYTAYLVDRRLPDGDGQTLLASLRHDDPDAAIVIMTGYGDLAGAIEAVRHGAMDYILKPINPDALRTSLQRIDERRRLEARVRQSERLAAIGTMLSAVSHEVRNEFYALQLSLELLQAGCDASDTEQSRAIARLHEGHARLQRQFEDIRGFAAPIQLDRIECSMDDVWFRAWSSLRPVWEGRDAELHEVVEASDLKCFIDDLRIEQVFRNILENALAACPDPIRLQVHCTAERLHGGEALSIAIRDNGPGMNHQQKQKVFDAFFTTKSKGTGLGMAIVKRIVDAHRGTIGVCDAEPRGAVFVVTLPRNGHARRDHRHLGSLSAAQEAKSR